MTVSTERSILVLGVSTQYTNIHNNNYFVASQNFRAGIAASHLSIYIKLFNNYDRRRAEAQKQLLIDVLEKGVSKMSAAQSRLVISSKKFNLAFGKLSTLRTRFENEFTEKSEFFDSKLSLIRNFNDIANTVGAIYGIFGIPISYATRKIEKEFVRLLLEKMESIKKFYDKLQEKVQQAFDNIRKTKSILSTEIDQIGELKVKTQQTETFVSMDNAPEIRDIVIEYATALIDKCEEYRQRHINKTDLL